MADLTIVVKRGAEDDLVERAKRLRPKGPPIQLDPLERAVHFLRGVSARATMVLPAFYLFLGAKTNGDPECMIEGYPGIVLKHAIRFSSVGTISLSCRKAFDHGGSGLTGANFAKTSDEVLSEVATYWSGNSGHPVEEALAALNLLRAIFRECAKSDTALLNTTAPLCLRIALLKQHANRSAAHLSLENFEFSTLDCTHVVAALIILGEIIRSFDEPGDQPTYFDTLDEASLSAARQLFPSTPDTRLFASMKIETQARLCWQWGIEMGGRMLLEQLPYAIGWC
jgi:hypothetical protein